MNVRRWITPAITVAVLCGVGAVAFATRETWLPYLFPATKPPAAEEAKHGSADQIKLSPQAQKNLKLDVDLIDPQPYWRTMLIPGVVVDRPGESDRGVSARLAGVVTKIHAKPGDTVAAGEPLVTLQLVSEVVQGAQRDLATAAKELAIATADRDRVAKQVADKIVAATTLVEPENRLKRAVVQVQGVRKQLGALGLSKEQIDQAETGELVTEITIPVPDRGEPVAPRPATGGSAADPKPVPVVYEVQELKVTLGQTVQAGEGMVLLAYHQKLYVEGRAFKSEATALAKLAETKTPVRAEFADERAGDWPEQPPLIVHHLSNVVDPETRTFAFYLPLDNQPRTFERDGKTHFVWRYRPGQRVRLRVPVEKLGDAVLVLPAGAVVREGAEAFAFVQNGDIFVRKAVRVLYQDRTDVVLADDGSLPSGAFVVRNQAAVINRAIKAQAAGGGGDPHAGHNH